MRNICIVITFNALLFISCSEKKESALDTDFESVIVEEDSNVDMRELPRTNSTVDMSETPASKPGPGIGSSENGLSTDVDKPISRETKNDSMVGK